MSLSTANLEVDRYLREKAPLEKKKEFLHLKSFSFWLLILGAYIVFVLHDLLKRKDGASMTISKEDMKLLGYNALHAATGYLISAVYFSLLVVIFRIIMRFLTYLSIFAIALCLGVWFVISIKLIFNYNPNTKILPGFEISKVQAFTHWFYYLFLGVYLYYGVPTVPLREISEIIKKSYKAIQKFPLAIFLVSFLFLKSSRIVTYNSKVDNFYDDVYNVIDKLAAMWMYFFGFVIFSKIYATWYWTEDNQSTSFVKTVFRAIWTTIRYDLGIVAYASSIWSWIPVIVTISRNVSKNDHFRKQPLLFKFFFTVGSILNTFLNGLCIGACHNSGFPESTKFGGFLYFKNSLKFAAVTSVAYEIARFHCGITDGLADVTMSGVFGDPIKTSITIDNFLPSFAFDKLIMASVISLMLFVSESSERNNPPTSVNVG